MKPLKKTKVDLYKYKYSGDEKSPSISNNYQWDDLKFKKYYSNYYKTKEPQGFLSNLMQFLGIESNEKNKRR